MNKLQLKHKHTASAGKKAEPEADVSLADMSKSKMVLKYCGETMKSWPKWQREYPRGIVY